jgi:hypothetical protein
VAQEVTSRKTTTKPKLKILEKVNVNGRIKKLNVGYAENGSKLDN